MFDSFTRSQSQALPHVTAPSHSPVGGGLWDLRALGEIGQLSLNTRAIGLLRESFTIPIDSTQSIVRHPFSSASSCPSSSLHSCPRGRLLLVSSCSEHGASPFEHSVGFHTCHPRRPCRFPPLLLPPPHLPTPSPPQPTSNLLLSIPSPSALAASCAKPFCFQSWPALSLIFAPSRSARCVNHHGCFLLLTTNMSPYSDHPSKQLRTYPG